MTMSRSSRRLNFHQRRRLADAMEQEAVDGVITTTTIKEYVGRMAHVLGMDSVELSTDTVTRLAIEIGVTLRTTASSQSLKVSALLQRLIELEKRHEALSAVHNRVAQEHASLSMRVDELERLYVEISGNVMTVTAENAHEVAQLVRAVEKRHDKHR